MFRLFVVAFAIFGCSGSQLQHVVEAADQAGGVAQVLCVATEMARTKLPAEACLEKFCATVAQLKRYEEKAKELANE